MDTTNEQEATDLHERKSALWHGLQHDLEYFAKKGTPSRYLRVVDTRNQWDDHEEDTFEESVKRRDYWAKSKQREGNPIGMLHFVLAVIFGISTLLSIFGDTNVMGSGFALMFIVLYGAVLQMDR